ncbi:hypothetical protein ACWPKS_10045 [Coraliomargarita sp. W4R72]
MKTAITLLSLTLVCFASLRAAPQGDNRPPEDRKNETRMLHHLLEMEQADLTALRKTIERIERMTPEEKALLLDRITKLEKMKPERLEAMREHFDAIDPEVRDTMHQRWLEMTSEERRAWRKKLHDIPEEERINLFKEEGFLPTPGKPPKGPRPPRPAAE